MQAEKIITQISSKKQSNWNGKVDTIPKRRIRK